MSGSRAHTAGCGSLPAPRTNRRRWRVQRHKPNVEKNHSSSSIIVVVVPHRVRVRIVPSTIGSRRRQHHGGGTFGEAVSTPTPPQQQEQGASTEQQPQRYITAAAARLLECVVCLNVHFPGLLVYTKATLFMLSLATRSLRRRERTAPAMGISPVIPLTIDRPNSSYAIAVDTLPSDCRCKLGPWTDSGSSVVVDLYTWYRSYASYRRPDAAPNLDISYVYVLL